LSFGQSGTVTNQALFKAWFSLWMNPVWRGVFFPRLGNLPYLAACISVFLRRILDIGLIASRQACFSEAQAQVPQLRCSAEASSYRAT